MNHNNNNNNNSIILGHFLPSSLLQQSSSIRRLTSTSSDSGDSGVDSSYRQERKIFVGGIPSTVGPEELAHFFQSYGQVEEAFIIYDRYSGRHRGFGFVTFADMSSTKSVCSTRIFNLHGRKIECKRALKREEILAHHEGDFSEYKSFRPSYSDDPSPSSPLQLPAPLPPPSVTSTLPCNAMSNNIPMGPTTIPFTYGQQYRQSSPSVLNTLGGWIVNPSMQTIPQLFHPMFNSQQQYAVLSLPTWMWNNPYQPHSIQSPFIQELVVPGGATSPSMINF